MKNINDGMIKDEGHNVYTVNYFFFLTDENTTEFQLFCCRK